MKPMITVSADQGEFQVKANTGQVAASWVGGKEGEGVTAISNGAATDQKLGLPRKLERLADAELTKKLLVVVSL